MLFAKGRQNILIIQILLILSPLSGIVKTVSVAAKILAEARLVFDEDHAGFGEVVGVVGPERDAGQGFWIEVAPDREPPGLAACVGGAHGPWRVFTARGRDEADGGVLQRV